MRSFPPREAGFRPMPSETANSPLTMQSWFASQFFNFLHEVGGFLETAIHAGKTDIRNFIGLAQGIHYHPSQHFAGNFTFILVRHTVDDPLDDILDNFRTDRTLLARFLDARKQLVFREFFAPPVPFDY